MKSLFVLLLSACLVLGEGGLRPAAAQPAADAKGKVAGKSLEFTTYSRPYFVKNTFEPKEKQSFAVLKSVDDFNRVFGVGMVMRGPRPQINEETFKSKIVLAVVSRGPMCKYEVESVNAKGKGIEVRYNRKVEAPGTAQFAVPLIVAIPKGEYSSVKFVENGKQVKEVK
jgi:hypothetical protein